MSRKNAVFFFNSQRLRKLKIEARCNARAKAVKKQFPTILNFSCIQTEKQVNSKKKRSKLLRLTLDILHGRSFIDTVVEGRKRPMDVRAEGRRQLGFPHLLDYPRLGFDKLDFRISSGRASYLTAFPKQQFESPWKNLFRSVYESRIV